MTTRAWAVIPAAGRGSRFGGELPKQYLDIAGQALIAHALDAVLAHPDVAGVTVALAAGDRWWPGWNERCGKPVHACIGGSERADSVLAALHAVPAAVAADDIVLVHDAARPNLALDDLDRLLVAARRSPAGALLAAPVRDTLKRADAQSMVERTEPRERLWRALTPQAFARDALTRALSSALAQGLSITDEAMAMEYAGAHPQLVEGREDNLKVTTPADFALMEVLLARRVTHCIHRKHESS